MLEIYQLGHYLNRLHMFAAIQHSLLSVRSDTTFAEFESRLAAATAILRLLDQQIDEGIWQGFDNDH